MVECTQCYVHQVSLNQPLYQPFYLYIVLTNILLQLKKSSNVPGAISHVKVSLGKIQNPKFPLVDPFLCVHRIKVGVNITCFVKNYIKARHNCNPIHLHGSNGSVLFIWPHQCDCEQTCTILKAKQLA